MEPMIDRIGDEAAVHLLVDCFYDLIETLPQGAAIMDMHLRGHGLSHVRPEQFAFLCGFFGGRRYYHERHGHMNLREIHPHVEIRAQDAEDWLQEGFVKVFRDLPHYGGKGHFEGWLRKVVLNTVLENLRRQKRLFQTVETNGLEHLPMQSQMEEPYSNEAPNSITMREVIWESAGEIISAHPWGVGSGDVNDALKEKYVEKNLLRPLNENLNAHNQYLQTTIATGIPGLILFIVAMLLHFGPLL